jgi:hypothetical protein
MLEQSTRQLDPTSQRMTTGTISMTTEKSQPTSLTLTALMALFLFRQVQVREQLALADRDARVAEDAVVGGAGRARVPVHLRAAVIGRFHSIRYQKDRAFARSFCLCREWRS